MEFTDRYKNYSNSELLKIIDNPNNFQPLAVETAKAIFESRQLSDEDIEIAKATIAIQRQEKEAHDEKKKVLGIKVKNIGASLVDTFYPIQTNTPTTDKIIKIVSIVFGGIFLYQLFKEIGMIKFMFTDSEDERDFSIILYFLPLLIVPIATVLFYTRKKIGWTLLAIFLTYSAVNAILLFFMELNRMPSGIPALDILFPTTSPVTHLGTIIFFCGILWVICKDSIREIYTIEKKPMVRTIGVTATVVGLFTSFYF